MSKKSYLDLLHEIESGNSSGLEITDLINIPKSSASRKDVADEMIRSIESSYGDRKEYSSYEEEPYDEHDDGVVYDEYIDDSDDDSNDGDVINDFINKCNQKSGKKKKKKSGMGIPYEMLSQTSSERYSPDTHPAFCCRKSLPEILIVSPDVHPVWHSPVPQKAFC